MTGIFEIKEPKVKGQFCLLAFKLYSDKYNGVLPQDLLSHLFVSGTINTFRFYDLLYCSCQAYSRLTKEPFDYDYDHFINDCQEINQGELTVLITKLWEAKMLGSSIKDFIKQGAEKEQAPKKK